MIKLHIPFWELLARGAVMSMIAVFMIRGHLLKQQLRAEMIARKRA
jgi:hypothetical protein